MMVRSTVTSGSSKEFASISSQNSHSCLMLELKLMTMQSPSSLTTCRLIQHAVAAVVRLKLSWQKIWILHHFLLELPNSMNTRWVIPLTRHSRALLGLILCCQEHIACSDGRLSKKGQWMPFSSWWIRKESQQWLRQMNTWPRTESCVFKSTLNKTVVTTWPTFRMPKLTQMPQTVLWCLWNREEDGWTDPSLQHGG